MTKKNLFNYLQIFLAAVLVLLFLISAFLKRSDKPLNYFPMPDFTLTEKNGKQTQKTSLDGKVWIADFIFTRCAGQCPVMSAKMAQLSQVMKDISFVSFSVDPTHDTPEVLSAYADQYGADRQRWLFLTGPMNEINRIATGLKLSRVDEPMMHSTSFILVDGKGMVRGLYDTNEPSRLSQLKHDAQIVKIEKYREP